MILNLSEPMMGFLNAMIRRPTDLPLRDAQCPIFMVTEYNEQKDLAELEDWLENEVLTKNNIAKAQKGERISANINREMASLLLRIVKHYQNVGSLAFGCAKMYIDIRRQLEENV